MPILNQLSRRKCLPQVNTTHNVYDVKFHTTNIDLNSSVKATRHVWIEKNIQKRETKVSKKEMCVGT